MFTTLFVGCSAVVGGVISVSYAGRALMEAGLALTRGKTEVTALPFDEGHQEKYIPPSLGLAAKTFVTELTTPLAALSISVEELCRSAKDVGHEAWHGAGRLLNRLDKKTSAPETVNVVAAPSELVVPNQVATAEPTQNLQPA